MKNKLQLLILKEKKTIITGLLVGLVLFLIYFLFFYIPLYSTTSKLFIRNIQRPNVIASIGGNSVIQSESGYSNPLFNMVQILQSPKLASNSYDTLSKKYPEDLKKFGVKSKEAWPGRFNKLIKAKIEPSTDIIKVTFNWDNGKTANKALDDIIAEYKNVNLEIRRSVEKKQSDYLLTQLTDIGDQLDSVRKDIKKYRVENHAIDTVSESAELTKARVDLEKQAELLRSQVSFNDKRLADLADQLNVPNAKTALKATGIGQDPYLAQLTQSLAVAQQNYAKLSAKFTDNYPDVVAAKNEIKSLMHDIQARQKETLQNIVVKRGIYDRPSQDIVTDMARIEADSISSKAQLSTLESSIQTLKQEEADIPAKVLGLEELQKKEAALVTAYTNVKQKQLEANLRENEIVDNIIPLGPSTEPVFLFPIILVRFIGFLALGFLGALGIVWIKEDIEDKWFNASEIEVITDKNVLGVIPWLKSEDQLPKTFFQDSNSIMGVSYGNIASSIVSKSYKNNAQALSFVSTLPERGKSLIIPNLAATLARFKRSVILVDTDFGEPAKLLNHIGVKPESVEKDLLFLVDEINKQTRLSGPIAENELVNLFKNVFIPVNVPSSDGSNACFYYLCVNKKIDNLFDYISTPGFSILIEYLKKTFEFVLIDTPSKPVVFPEFSAITGNSDAAVLISAMETNRQDLISLINKLDKSSVKILGVIAREENSELEKYFNSKTEPSDPDNFTKEEKKLV